MTRKEYNIALGMGDFDTLRIGLQSAARAAVERMIRLKGGPNPGSFTLGFIRFDEVVEMTVDFSTGQQKVLTQGLKGLLADEILFDILEAAGPVGSNQWADHVWMQPFTPSERTDAMQALLGSGRAVQVIFDERIPGRPWYNWYSAEWAPKDKDILLPRRGK